MVKNHEELIKDLTKRCKVIIGQSFDLKCSGSNSMFHYTSNGTEEAKNYKKDSPNLVKVLHWFGSFWIFMEVRFYAGATAPSRKSKRIVVQTSISISIFQDENGAKTQLFRAEWDDFSENKGSHPQPHWHIVLDNQNYTSFLDLVEEYIGDDFTSLLKLQNKPLLNIKNMHFAMMESWHLESSHAKIENNANVVSWVIGLLDHIKTELIYITN